MTESCALISDAGCRLSGPDIALFVPTLRGGGAERVMVNLANTLAERGFSVDLVLVRKEGDYFHLVSSEVGVVDLDSARIITALPKLVAYFRREHPKVMLSTLTYANVVAIWAKHLSGKSTRVVVREANAVGRVREYSESWKDWLVPWFARVVYPGADVVIGVSAGVADELVEIARLDRNMVKVIYNPVVTHSMLQAAAEPVEHPWFDEIERKIVLGAGRLVRQKDFATLIRAFAIVREEVEANLVILGEGEKRLELLALASDLGIADAIDLPGFKENPFSYMYGSDVFVLSSRHEGLPGVLIQALATGCPVVSTNCPYGPREILQGGRWGELVPVGDARSMGEAIIATLKSDWDAEALQNRAMEFSVQEITDRYLSVMLPPEVNTG